MGNEEADQLAKASTKKKPSYPLNPPISYIKKELKTELLRTWQKEWEAATVGRLTFDFLPKINTNFISECAATNEVLTGHGPFLSYLKKFGKAETDQCVCGGGKGDSMHYLLKCPLTQKWHLKPPTAENKKVWLNSLSYNKTVQNKVKQLLVWLNVNQTRLISSLNPLKKRRKKKRDRDRECVGILNQKALSGPSPMLGNPPKVLFY